MSQTIKAVVAHGDAAIGRIEPAAEMLKIAYTGEAPGTV